MTTGTPPVENRSQLAPGWTWTRLSEVIVEAQGGFASGQRDPKGAIQLRMNNVTSRGQFDWSSVIRVPADSDIITTYRLHVGDVLFNNTNSTDLVGKTALFEGYEEAVLFSNHFTRLRTAPDSLDPFFLLLWLHGQWLSRVFAIICNRWIGQSAVQRDKLLALEMPLPPLREQQRIVGILRGEIDTVERARTAALAQLDVIDALPQVLLRRAFAGDL